MDLSSRSKTLDIFIANLHYNDTINRQGVVMVGAFIQLFAYGYLLYCGLRGGNRIVETYDPSTASLLLEDDRIKKIISERNSRILRVLSIPTNFTLIIGTLFFALGVINAVWLLIAVR